MYTKFYAIICFSQTLNRLVINMETVVDIMNISKTDGNCLATKSLGIHSQK